jgi:hypothetical protein
MKPACYIPAPTPAWPVDRLGSIAIRAVLAGAVLYGAAKLIGFASCIGALS